MNNFDVEKKMTYPSIFSETPSPFVSEKYQFIRTSDVLETLMDLGWNTRQMSEVRARKPHTKGFQKHLIRLTNPGLSIGKNVGEEIPELILTNSHNGKNSFSFKLGIYRLVCSNGLVIPVEEFANITIKHVGQIPSQIKKIMDESIKTFPLIYKDIDKMKNRELTEREIRGFAKTASELRNPNLSKSLTVGLDQILEELRPQDSGNDLWKVYNRVQENLINGNYEIKTKKGSRKGSSIKSIDNGIKINEGLWNLAKSYLD